MWPIVYARGLLNCDELRYSNYTLSDTKIRTKLYLSERRFTLFFFLYGHKRHNHYSVRTSSSHILLSIRCIGGKPIVSFSYTHPTNVVVLYQYYVLSKIWYYNDYLSYGGFVTINNCTLNFTPNLLELLHFFTILSCIVALRGVFFLPILARWFCVEMQ